MINLESVGSVVALVAMLATGVERGVEMFRPGFIKITNTYWQNSVKIGLAIILGVAVAALTNLDIAAMLGLKLSPWAGYASAGVLASAGAAPWHAFLEWIKSIRKPTE